jgi:hypothetical protein
MGSRGGRRPAAAAAGGGSRADSPTGAAEQAGAVVVLSVVIRWGPVVTGVNGRLVARPAGTTMLPPGATVPSSARG